MSGQCMGWVLRQGPKDRAMRAVLITIADAANRDGDHAHPGKDAMIEGSLYGRSMVTRTVAKLIVDRWIEVEQWGVGRGQATVYRVLMDRAPTTADPVTQPPVSGHSVAPSSKGKRPQKRPLQPPKAATPASESGHSPYLESLANGKDPTTTNNRSSRRTSSDALTLVLPLTPAQAPSEVVTNLCTLLADLIEANGSSRPSVTEKWHTECERLIRIDGRTPPQVENAIRWSQADPFWRSNVLSMPTLRAQYDKLRLAAKRTELAAPVARIDAHVMQAMAWAADLEGR